MSQGRTDRDACLIEVAAVTASSINHEETGRAEGERAREEGATCPNRRHLGELSLSWLSQEGWGSGHQSRDLVDAPCSELSRNSFHPVLADAPESAGGRALGRPLRELPLGPLLRRDSVKQSHGEVPASVRHRPRRAKCHHGAGSTRFGAKWWVVAPDGAPITTTAPSGQRPAAAPEFAVSMACTQCEGEQTSISKSTCCLRVPKITVRN
jgi:hypothetical protein